MNAAESVLRELLETADVRIGGVRPFDLTVCNPALYERVLRDGALGLGESYVEQWWECDAIDEMVCRVLRADLPTRVRPNWRLRLAALRARIFNVQRGRGGHRVAELHYDAGNELFCAMLGPTMNYSCAYWRRASDLDAAQRDKMDLICRKLDLRPEDRLLDVGCGWGGLCEHAARHYGCHAVGVTISKEQFRFATEQFTGDAGGNVVQFHLLDYRDPRLSQLGPFTKVASVGMFEHVGHRNHRRFLRICHDLLPSNSLALVQTFGRTARTRLDPWVDRYVFPNSYLPDLVDIGRATADLFVVEDLHNFGADYDRTLMAWHERFTNWALRDGGMARTAPSRFRMWRYYLLSFAGCFRARSRIQLWQVVLSKGGVLGGYPSIR